MGDTPKSIKRKVEESPTFLYGNFSDSETIDVTYDFLPKSRLKARGDRCKIPLGLRPHKLIKSPTPNIRTPRQSVQKPPVKSQEKCEELFKSIFKESEKETVNAEELGESNNNFNEDCRDSSLFDDSSNDLMFELSQRIEEAQENKCTSSTDKTGSLVQKEITKKRPSSITSKKCDKFVASCPENSCQSAELCVNLLLEDGNDAGFFNLDETVFNESQLSSKISFTQKCTPQEIEAKRREALKKLQAKKLKTTPN